MGDLDRVTGSGRDWSRTLSGLPIYYDARVNVLRSSQFILVLLIEMESLSESENAISFFIDFFFFLSDKLNKYIQTKAFKEVG